MVTGTTRQVVLVKAPDDGVFEQAIYLLKSDAVSGGFREKDILAQAKLAAAGDLEQSVSRPRRRWQNALFFALGVFSGALPFFLLWKL